MQRTKQGPPGQKIGTATAQLAGGGTREHEGFAEFPFDQVMHHVQQLGHPLHLVDHHHLFFGLRQHQRLEPLRLRRKLAEAVGLKQIDVERIRIGRLKPSGLARAARAEEEVAARGWLEKAA